MLWGGFCVVGRLGRKKKRARGPPRAFYFFFDRDTQRKPLRRRENSESKQLIPPCMKENFRIGRNQGAFLPGLFWRSLFQGVQIVVRSDQVVRSEFNRTRGRRGGKTRGDRFIFPLSIFLPRSTI